MAKKIGFLTHMFGGPRKKAESILKQLPVPALPHQLYDAVRTMRAEKIDDVMMIMTMWDIFHDPGMIIIAAVLDKKKNFPALNDDLVSGWPWGDDNLWKGFMSAGGGSKAKAAGLLVEHHPDKAAADALIKAFCKDSEIIEEYIRTGGRDMTPLAGLWTSLNRDLDSLWLEIKKDRTLYEAVNLLLDLVPERAGDVVAMNLNISTMVEELIANAPDQGGIFRRAIESMNYSMTKFWVHVLEFQHNNKKAAIRFVFINGQDLLEPMLLAIINDTEMSASEKAPTLQDIVAVFAEESGEETEDEEILTAEQVTNRLGWSGADVWTAVTDYTQGNIAEAVMLISRHFPGQMDELVFKQMDMSYILQEIGEHFRSQPGRADLFCKRNEIDYRQALTAILEFAETEEMAVQWFCECFPRLGGKNLAELVQEDPAGADEILQAPWSDQVVWLALVTMLDCEATPEEALQYVQKNWPFFSPYRLAKGMFDDGFPTNEVLVTYLDGTTGPLTDFSKLTELMGMTPHDAMRVIYHAGEQRKGMRDVNELLSDMCLRVDAVDSMEVWNELARRKSSMVHEPDKLVDYILKTVPGLVKRPGGLEKLWNAFKVFYGAIELTVTERLVEAVSSTVRRDRHIEYSFEQLQELAAAPDAVSNPVLIAAAERMRLVPEIFLGVLKGDIATELRQLAAMEPSALQREHTQALRMMDIDQEQLRKLLEIQALPAKHFPYELTAGVAGISADDVKKIVRTAL